MQELTLFSPYLEKTAAIRMQTLVKPFVSSLMKEKITFKLSQRPHLLPQNPNDNEYRLQKNNNNKTNAYTPNISLV